MSTRELRRAEVLARVKSETPRLVDAAKMLELSYRQTKRLWQRYRKEGAKGLQHRSAGRGSNRAKPEKFRRKVLQLIREKYSGTEQERFGPTLAAEHLAEEDGLEVGEETPDQPDQRLAGHTSMLAGPNRLLRRQLNVIK